MKRVPIKLYDAFTNHIFGGNIAGVITKTGNLTNTEMQKIASEINAPTTGFVFKRGENDFEVKFFTPTQEVDMCGHAVVATFMALAEENKLDNKNKIRVIIKQYTKAGLIPVEVFYKNRKPAKILMKQHNPIFKDPKLSRGKIAGLLGIPDEFIEENYPIEIASTALRHLFVPVKNIETMEKLNPDFPALTELSHKLNVETIDVFTLETVRPESDVHSRDFCPGIGNLEEAASGTTNGALSCYLIKHKALSGITNNGIVCVSGEQGFEMGRPSIIRSEITLENSEIKEVKVGGSAVCFLKGEILALD